MTPEEERDRYKFALEEILVLSSPWTLVLMLADRALDLTRDYPFDGADVRDYLGIHPSNDPRLK